MDVGVRELKQRLSEYLDQVAAGEHIRVTDRGVPKAIISPIVQSGELARGVADGWVRPASRIGLSPVRRYPSARSVREALAEDRGE